MTFVVARWRVYYVCIMCATLRKQRDELSDELERERERVAKLTKERDAATRQLSSRSVARRLDGPEREDMEAEVRRLRGDLEAERQRAEAERQRAGASEARTALGRAVDVAPTLSPPPATSLSASSLARCVLASPPASP